MNLLKIVCFVRVNWEILYTQCELNLGLTVYPPVLGGAKGVSLCTILLSFPKRVIRPYLHEWVTRRRVLVFILRWRYLVHSFKKNTSVLITVSFLLTYTEPPRRHLRVFSHRLQTNKFTLTCVVSVSGNETEGPVDIVHTVGTIQVWQRTQLM